MTAPSLIILGASARSAAFSARRAGWTPWCADLFADADLERIAPVRKVPAETYPDGLLDALKAGPDVPVLYTGALENRPDLIARIDRPLWGNSPEVLSAVRSPQRWTQCLEELGLSVPACTDARGASGRWLVKPRQSAGGFGISVYAGQAFDPGTHFLQERIDGVAASAVYVGDGADALFLGATQQLIGTPWLNAGGFRYAGSIGPLPLGEPTRSRWQRLGAALAKNFHLLGLFGVDAVVCDGVPWPVEINPRYTASIEILERASRLPLLPLHRAAFESARRLGDAPHLPARTVCGKAILYARRTFAFPPQGPWQAALREGIDLDEIDHADIPHAGDIIDEGRPVLTLFATAVTLEQCEQALQEKAQALDRRLWG